MCIVYFTSGHLDVSHDFFLDPKEPVTFLFDKLLIRIQLKLNVICFIVQLCAWITTEIAHCLGLDVFIVLDLRLQLLIFLNRGMIQVVFREEFTSCSPSSTSGVNAHMHIWFKRMVQHRRWIVQPKSTGLSLGNGPITLGNDLAHLSNHLLHHSFWDFLLLNRIQVLDFYHGQWQRIMGLIVLSLDLLFDHTWLVRLVLVIDVEFFEVGQDQIPFLRLLGIDVARLLQAHRRRFHTFPSF